MTSATNHIHGAGAIGRHDLLMTACFRLLLQPHFRLHQHKEVVVLANGHHGLNEEALRAEDLVVVQDLLALVKEVAYGKSALDSADKRRLL
jgi:hypothetical protein